MGSGNSYRIIGQYLSQNILVKNLTVAFTKEPRSFVQAVIDGGYLALRVLGAIAHNMHGHALSHYWECRNMKGNINDRKVNFVLIKWEKGDLWLLRLWHMESHWPPSLGLQILYNLRRVKRRKTPLNIRFHIIKLISCKEIIRRTNSILRNGHMSREEARWFPIGDVGAGQVKWDPFCYLTRSNTTGPL